MAKTLEKKSLKREKKEKEKCAGETSHEPKDEGSTTEDNVDQKQEDSFLSGDFVEDKICEKETSNCKESVSLPCFKLAKPSSLEEFLNEKEKTVMTLPDSDNIASSDLHVRDFKKNENIPATDDIIVLEDKADDKLKSFKKRFFRQHRKSNACGLKNVSKSETKISHRMTLNFAEMPAGNSSGMKFSDLKEHLISAMQKKKEVAFKKFKESDNIDNEIASFSDEELYEGSSTGRYDSLRGDIEDICSTTSSSEFEENVNKPTSQEEKNFETAESETKHEFIITPEENKYEEASAASTKVEIGSVEEFLDTGIMDAQFIDIQEEIVTTHFDDVHTCQPRYCIEGKTYSTATAVENLDKELKCAMENEKELATQKNSETDRTDNECDSDVIYCGYISASNSAKNYKAVRKSAEKIVNNFQDSEVKETSNTEEPKIIFEKFCESEPGASSSHSNAEDYINITKKTFYDPHSNEKHSEANSAQNDIVLNTASDSVESMYNFDLEYLTSSAIPSYQPCAASSKHSCSVQPLDENSVEEVIQSSTNEMTTQDYNADTTGRYILSQGKRGTFPFSFSHCYMQNPLRSHFLESGLYISNIGNAGVKLSARESSFMCDVFASQEVNDFCSGPFITPFEEKNVKEVHSATVKDSAATLADDDSDVVLLDRSESEEEKVVSSSSSSVDLPLHMNVSVCGSPSYGRESSNHSSSPPHTRDPMVFPDEYEVEERKFSGESEEDKSINSGVECGEECKGGPVVHSEEEDEGKISSDETGLVVHSEEEEEGEISFDGIGKYKRASCASQSENEYNADEERKIVFEKSIRDYIDDEAVLSGDDDEDDDDDEEDMEVDSDAEKECADGEAIENSEMLRKQIAPMHMKQVLADDDRAVKFLQNKFLNEGDLHSTGARNRKFVWKNNTSTLNENLCEESEDDDDDTEVQEAHEMMREKFLHEEKTESDNEDNFIIGSNKSLNLCVLENTASPSEVRPAAKRPRSSMLSNEEDSQTKLKRRKMKDEATTSGTRALKNCVFRADDTETGNKILDAKIPS
ncbi:Claspin, partial [Stegodyphus mimosarum]